MAKALVEYSRRNPEHAGDRYKKVMKPTRLL
ncbi:hypothetical protein shim_32190 [Shimia sp. SK013]|nr:hypothetical protein shim_32190 [Shimia sp. SK013]